MSDHESNLEQQSDLPHILIVDDDNANRDILKRVLEDNYRVTCVANGPAALELLEKEQFDTVLLDIMMPFMSGLKVLEIIRGTPEIADLPVILVSALSDTTDIVNGLKSGANDYLTKPSDVSIIHARINTQVMFKRLMDENKRVIAQLKDAQAIRDRLFRVASHDLKAPLTNIRMAEFILRDLVSDSAAGQQVLDTMVTTLDNMQGVIEQFLDVALFQSGKLELNLAPIKVENAVMDIIMEFAMSAGNKDINLEVGNIPGVVTADAKRLRQILGNLLGNAIKYSPKNTNVAMWSELLGDQIRINIADQGPGIPVDEQHLLFQEFGRLSNRPTGNESSTGLGLWIVKHLITLHNGSVGVDCPADGGSIFWVTLPVCMEELRAE